MQSHKNIITTKLKISNDVLADFQSKSIIDLSSKEHEIEVLFYRYIGIGSGEESYRESIRSVFAGLLEKNIPFLHYVDEISESLDSHSVEAVKTAFSICEDRIDIKCVCENLEKNHSFYNSCIEVLNFSAAVAFRKALSLFMSNNKNVNTTIIKSFCAKLLSWVNTALAAIDPLLGPCKPTGMISLPKVIYMGEIKNHEVYFLIFMSMLGCDVLFVNPSADFEFSSVDKYDTYSKRQTNGNAAPSFDYEKSVPSISKEYFSYEEPFDSISTSLKSTRNIFSDICLALSERAGFISSTPPTIPVFFYRVIGIHENANEYYNDLYSLHKKLSALGSLYIKFEGNIPMPSSSASSGIGAKLSDLFEDFDFKNSILWINFFKKNEMMKVTSLNAVNNSFEKNLKLVLDLYIKNTPGINLTKLKNFCLKMLIWSQEYVSYLFSDFSLDKDPAVLNNPKVLYYGDIKLHEIYFLILLSKTGCDVLYLNTSSDGAFSEIDKNQVYSKSMLLPQKQPLEPFPRAERIAVHETLAYKSSKEISTIIYSDEDGFYKPWQFENHRVSPVTLRTTYDELKILWKEQSRLRSGFKADSSTVFVPNIFSKISGVHSDIQEYAQDVQLFKSGENIFFTSSVPFSSSSRSDSASAGYSRTGAVKGNPSYPYRFFFDELGNIEKQALVSSSLYKFSHVKTSTQDAIIEKAQYLMDSDILLSGHCEDMRIRILSVILNMDKSLLNLIQKFDYPFDIPKFVAYHSSETIFSLEDCITIAFLYLFGFDILIITPTGYNNLEKHISQKYFDIHRLENVMFDLDIQKLYAYSGLRRKKDKSFWSSIFKPDNNK